MGKGGARWMRVGEGGPVVLVQDQGGEGARYGHLNLCLLHHVETLYLFLSPHPLCHSSVWGTPKKKKEYDKCEMWSGFCQELCQPDTPRKNSRTLVSSSSSAGLLHHVIYSLQRTDSG